MTDGVRFLADRGLNLFFVPDCEPLPQPHRQWLRDAALDRFPRLVFIGNGGGSFRNLTKDFKTDDGNPLDRYSLAVADTFLTRCPQGSVHRYGDEQIAYHYSGSMASIKNAPFAKETGR